MRLSLIAASSVALLLAKSGLAQSDDDAAPFSPSFVELTYRISPEISCRRGDSVVAATIRAQDPERKNYLLEMTVQVVGVLGQDECLVVLPGGCILHRQLTPRLLSAGELVSLSAAVDRVLADLPEGEDPFCLLWDPCMFEEYTIDGQLLPVGPCGKPRMTFEQGDALFELLELLRQGNSVLLENGDTNGDRERDVSDAVHLLNWLFLGGTEPVPIACNVDFDCAGVVTELENGDTNGDGKRDLSDPVHLLDWLFVGGTEPLPICFCS